VNIEDLTPEEHVDIDNYIEYVSKRLAAGAVTSKAFHEEIMRGNPLKALETFNPDRALGHDSLHAMFAYAESGGASLLPAYMKVDRIDTSAGVNYGNDKANLEELYVTAFTIPETVLKPICEDLIQKGYSGEELVQAVIERWDSDVAQRPSDARNNFQDPNYVKENILPEFVTIVRNYCREVENGDTNPKFSLNELRRILRPLLDRLERKSEIDSSEASLESEELS
jgi:hypothetical protein